MQLRCAPTPRPGASRGTRDHLSGCVHRLLGREPIGLDRFLADHIATSGVAEVRLDRQPDTVQDPLSIGPLLGSETVADPRLSGAFLPGRAVVHAPLGYRLLPGIPQEPVHVRQWDIRKGLRELVRQPALHVGPQGDKDSLVASIRKHFDVHVNPFRRRYAWGPGANP